MPELLAALAAQEARPGLSRLLGIGIPSGSGVDV
jgi:hypothetical protein